MPPSGKLHTPYKSATGYPFSGGFDDAADGDVHAVGRFTEPLCGDIKAVQGRERAGVRDRERARGYGAAGAGAI